MPERMQPSASPSAIGNPDFRSESVDPEWDQKYSSGGDEDTLADALGDVVVKAQIPSEPDSEGDVDGLAPAAPIVNPPPSVPTQPVIPPLVILPNGSDFVSNYPLTVTGACTVGLLVTVAGDVQASDVSSPINSQQQPCIDSTFSYTINKSIAATYEILFTQSNPATNVTSDSTKIRWIFDNVAPLTADILQPNGLSARSSDNVFLISGVCEASGSLLFDGAETTTVDCQDGVFSRSFNSTTDGVFTWNIRQQDLAGNLSPSTIVIWTRDSTAPATPSISSPHNNSYYAASTVVVSGSCTSGMKVFVGGNASAGEVVSPYGILEQLCVENSYSFTIQKQSDASYDFSILQRDAVTNVASTAAVVRWTRDTSAPALPIVTQPTQARVRNSENTITIAGTCETDALVNFSGSSSTELICTSGTFS